MKWTTYIPNMYVTHSKLQTAVLEMLRKIDRSTFDNAYLDVFKANLLLKIDKLNDSHKSCRPIKSYWSPDGPDLILHMSPSVCNFYLMQSNDVSECDLGIITKMLQKEGTI